MKKRREAIAGYLFALPWIIGFFVFLFVPLARSLYNSFTDYSVLKSPVWVGTKNYENLLRDELFWSSLGNTFYFAGFSIPLGTIAAIALALLLNSDIKGQPLFRTIFFLPSLIPAVPLSILWLWLFNGEFGLVNYALDSFVGVFRNLHAGLGGGPIADILFGWATTFKNPNWFGDPWYSKPVLIIMAIWGVGNAVVIYLAGLQQVPQSLYEAADLDGASPWLKTLNVTIPMISPVIMFNVIMGIIGALQVFTQAYIIFPGGAPARSTYMYSMYIFDTAFRDLRMGYASAMGWVMFLIILCLTFLALRFFEKRVTYDRG